MKFALNLAVFLCVSATAFADGLDGLYQGSIFAPQTGYGLSAYFNTNSIPGQNPPMLRPFLNGSLEFNFPDLRRDLLAMSFSLGQVAFSTDNFASQYSERKGQTHDFSMATVQAESVTGGTKLSGFYFGKLMTDTVGYDLLAVLKPTLVQRESDGDLQAAILGALTFKRADSSVAVKNTLIISDGIYDESSGQLALQLSNMRGKPAILANCQVAVDQVLTCAWQSLVNGKKFDFILRPTR